MQSSDTGDTARREGLGRLLIYRVIRELHVNSQPRIGNCLFLRRPIWRRSPAGGWCSPCVASGSLRCRRCRAATRPGRCSPGRTAVRGFSRENSVRLMRWTMWDDEEWRRRQDDDLIGDDAYWPCKDRLQSHEDETFDKGDHTWRNLGLASSVRGRKM